MSLFVVVIALLSSLVMSQGIANINASCNATDQMPSLWDQYVCSVLQRRIDDRCVPQLLRGEGASRGLVVMFHGYTACPAAFSEYGAAFAQTGFDVMMVLDEGHGRAYRDCAAPGADCVEGDSVEYLPVNRSGYLDFVDRINAIVREQVGESARDSDFSTIAVGHSLGGGLASIAVIRGNSQESKLYDKLLLMSPFFGISVPPLDQAVLDCGDTTDCIKALADKASTAVQGMQPHRDNATESALLNVTESLRDALIESLTANQPPHLIEHTYLKLMAVLQYVLQELAESPFLSSALRNQTNSPMGWGAQCETDRSSDITMRAGYCNFRVKNLLAVHSQGQWALGHAHLLRHPITVQTVAVERDGNVRNSLAWQVMRSFRAANERLQSTDHTVQACLFRRNSTCNITSDGNACGVAHAFVAAADNLGVAPHTMFWQSTLLPALTRFLVTDEQVGVSRQAGGNFNVTLCQAQPVDKPDPKLVAAPARVIEVILNATVDKITNSIRQEVRQKIANMTGVPSWLVAMYDLPSQLLAKDTQQPDTVVLPLTIPGGCSFQKPLSADAMVGGLHIVSINDPIGPETQENDDAARKLKFILFLSGLTMVVLTVLICYHRTRKSSDQQVYRPMDNDAVN